MDTHSPTQLPRGRTGRGKLGTFSGLLLIAALFVLIDVALWPWALHIGGQSTPLGQWDGFGQVEASNGGRYVLFAHLEGGLLARTTPSRRGGGPGRGDDLKGTAELCTQAGLVHAFKLAGEIDAWSTTDGAPTRLHLTGGTPTPLPSGWTVALHGAWHGPELQLHDPDSSFVEVFAPRGEIRHVTSTADAGTARVTLRFGSQADFQSACRALRERGR